MPADSAPCSRREIGTELYRQLAGIARSAAIACGATGAAWAFLQAQAPVRLDRGAQVAELRLIHPATRLPEPSRAQLLASLTQLASLAIESALDRAERLDATVQAAEAHAALAGSPQVFEREIATPAGQRHSLARYQPHVVDGRVVGVLVEVIDVSQLKDIEHELRRQIRTREGAESRLRASFDALAARISADDFVVVLPHTSSHEDLRLICDRLIETLRAPITFLRGTTVRVRASMRVSLCPEHASTIEGLMRCADEAMYMAKASGHDTWKFYEGDA